MLSKRLLACKKNTRTYVIGVYGLHRYAGVTHLAILLAQYISNVRGRKVEVIEASGKEDMGCLAARYKINRSRNKSNIFTCRNITFMEHATTEELAMQQNLEYEFRILDLGSNYRKAINELMRCDLKIVVGNGAPWQQEAWELFGDLINEFKDINSWCYMCNLSKPNMPGWSFSINHYAMGFEPNLFHPSKATRKLFSKILQI